LGVASTLAILPRRAAFSMMSVSIRMRFNDVSPGMQEGRSCYRRGGGSGRALWQVGASPRLWNCRTSWRFAGRRQSGRSGAPEPA
jgi:hypothetical protein